MYTEPFNDFSGDRGDQRFERIDLSSGIHERGTGHTRSGKTITWKKLASKAAWILAGMANAEGGTLLIGEESSTDGGNFTVDNGFTGDEDSEPDHHEGTFPFAESTAILIVSEVSGTPEPALFPEVKWFRNKKGLLTGLSLSVTPSPVLHSVSGKIPLRLGFDTFPVELRYIETYRQMKFRSWYEEILVPGASMKDLDPELLNRLMALYRGYDDEETLLRERYGLITKDGSLKRAALLLFAKDPGAWYPGGGRIEFIRINGNRPAAERNSTKTGISGAFQRSGFSGIKQRAGFEGAIPLVLEHIFDFLDPELAPSRKSMDLFYNYEISGIPPRVWREAIVNAVAHRDYSVEGTSIDILVYDNAVEIRSPGGLPSFVNIGDMFLEPGIHLTRNPKICRVLTDMGFMKSAGTGLHDMMNSMIGSFLEPPRISSEGYYFRVSLDMHPVLPSGPGKLLSSLPVGFTLGERQKRIITYCLKLGSGFTTAQYRKINNVGRDTAYKEIRELREMGLVKPDRPTRARTYFLNTGVFYESGNHGRRFRYSAEAADKQDTKTDGTGGKPTDDVLDRGSSEKT